MRVVSTVKFGWTAADILQRQVASWASANPTAWMYLRGAWWLVTHPFHTAGIVLGGWMMLRGWWPPLAVAAGAAVPAAWRSWGLLRILTPLRGVGTLPQALQAIRRWRRLRGYWQRAAANAKLINAAKDRVPALQKVHATPIGLAAKINCGSIGWTPDKVAQAAEVIAAGIPGCRQVNVTPATTPAWAMMHFQWADPLGRTVRLDQLPLPPRGRLAFGITEDGEPASVDRQTSVFVAGLTGSGKSTILWALIASALATGTPIRLYVIDPSGGVELAELQNSPLVASYASRTRKPRNGNGTKANGSRRHADLTQPALPAGPSTDLAPVPAPSPKTATQVIGEFHTAMETRLAAMSGTTRLHKPTPQEPLSILVIDELLRLKNNGLYGEARADLEEIVSMGRKAGFVVWALTQLSAKDDLGALGALRDLFPQRICLATSNRAATDTMLGDSAETSHGARCSRIRLPGQAGMGYAAIDDIPGYTRFRGAWVPDSATRIIAKGHLPPRVQRYGADKVALEDRDHVLYAWYAPGQPPDTYPEWEPGELLYLGISHDGPSRANQHLRDGKKEWASEPGVKMRILERFDTRKAALDAEKKAIKELHPRYNIAHRRRALPPGPTGGRAHG